MKKVLLVIFLASALASFGKKVKFAVDMSTHTISAFGIHVMGDFQAVAGFTLGDFQPGTTLMSQEGTSTIYSVIVDIPAFRKYEYRFVNGDQAYETEIIPAESQVGYGFVDHRWIYVDSLANDTTFVGAIIFASNAPAGLKLIRYKVDMSNVTTIDPKLPHVAGNFQGWSPTKTILYSFGAKVYEIISYVTAGSYEYKFYNGNQLSNTETVPAACVVNGNRGINVTKDTVLATVCYASCSACDFTGISENALSTKGFKLFPNPTSDLSVIEFNDGLLSHSVAVSDLSGRVVRAYNNIAGTSFRIHKEALGSGVYFVSVAGISEKPSIVKLIIE